MKEKEKKEPYQKPAVSPLGNTGGELSEEDMGSVTGGTGDGPQSYAACMPGQAAAAECSAGYAGRSGG